MTVRTIEVKVDLENHNRAPAPGMEELTWKYLDTAWNLLRDAAVELTLQSMREQAAEQGIDFPSTDEELFQRAKDSGDPGAPTSYRQLAPSSEIAAQGLHAILQVLVNQSGQDAQEGLQDFQDEVE